MTGLRCSVIAVLRPGLVVCRAMIRRSSSCRLQPRSRCIWLLRCRAAPLPDVSRRTYRERRDGDGHRRASCDSVHLLNAGYAPLRTLLPHGADPLDTMRAAVAGIGWERRARIPTGRTVTFSPLHTRRPGPCRPGRGAPARTLARAPAGPLAVRWPRRRSSVGASVGIAAAAATGRRGQLGPRPRRRLPRPEHPLVGNGVYYGFATQNFAAREPDHQHPGVDLVRTASTGPQSTASMRCPRSRPGPSTGDTWAPSVAYNRQRVRHVLHGHRGLDRRPVHRRGHLVHAARALPSTPVRRPVVCQNGIDVGNPPPSTTATTAAASTLTSSRTRLGRLLADLEERRQPPIRP